MNFLRSRCLLPYHYLSTLRIRIVPTPPPKPPTPQSLIQTSPGRLSGQYIQTVRLATSDQIKKPWFKYFGLLLMLSVIPTYYLTYKIIQADQPTFQHHQNIRTAINTYYFRNVFFTSILAMIAALRFRNPTLMFIQKTNMSVAPFILPLVTSIVGLSLPPSWSNPAIMIPAFLSEGLLMFLMVTRRSLPVPIMYFKVYAMYYDLFVLVVLGICLWAYHKESKKMRRYQE